MMQFSKVFKNLSQKIASTLKKDAKKKNIPEKNIPEKNIPEKSIPEKSIPEKKNSKKDTKKDTPQEKSLSYSSVRPAKYLIQYKVGDDVVVTISEDMQYCVYEPQFSDAASKSAYDSIMSYKRFTRYDGNAVFSELSVEEIMSEAESAATELGLLEEFLKNYRTFQYYIRRDIFGFDVLNVLLQDESNLEDITCSNYNDTVGVVHRKYLSWGVMRTTIKFDSKKHMESLMEKMANRAYKHLSDATPMVDLQLDKKYRMSLVKSDVISPLSPALSIRIKSPDPITIKNLLDSNTISHNTVAAIWTLLDVRGTGLIIGGTGSGKTSTLGALLLLIKKTEKIITIEDTGEIQIPHTDWLPLMIDAPVSTAGYFKKFQAILNTSLRQRPYMISVGEVRGESTKMLFDAISTGHSSMSSFHAYGASGAINRIIGEIGVPAGSFTDLGFILSMGEIITKQGILERRCLSFDEISSDGHEVFLNNLGVYNADTDSFDNNSIPFLCENSKRLQAAVARDASTEMASDFALRVDLLRECQKRAVTQHETAEILSKYYEKKYQR